MKNLQKGGNHKNPSTHYQFAQWILAVIVCCDWHYLRLSVVDSCFTNLASYRVWGHWQLRHWLLSTGKHFLAFFFSFMPQLRHKPYFINIHINNIRETVASLGDGGGSSVENHALVPVPWKHCNLLFFSLSKMFQQLFTLLSDII